MMKLTIAAALALAFMLGLGRDHSQVFAATTIQVPADYSTIQGAIDAAASGDTIVVAPGVYVENIDFRGKAIEVRSADGPSLTTIDGGRARPVVSFISGEPSAAALRGFTVRNGDSIPATYNLGGGIRVVGSSPTITGNVIRDNFYCGGGGGVLIDSGSPRIEDNLISNNVQANCSGGPGGGGIYVTGFDASPTIASNIIEGSRGSGLGGNVVLHGFGSPLVSNNLIRDSLDSTYGGGIVVFGGSSALIMQNVITGNGVREHGAGVQVLTLETGTKPRIINNTIYGNFGYFFGNIFPTSEVDVFGWPRGTGAELTNNVIVSSGTAIRCVLHSDQYLPPALRSNNAWSASGEPYSADCGAVLGVDGNISADPQFKDALTGDVSLREGSPSIDAGSANAALPDTDFAGDARLSDGNGDDVVKVDQGAFEAPIPPWACGDFDGNGFVTNSDVELLRAAIRRGGFEPAFDVNVDGDLTGLDLSMVMHQLGLSCSRQ